MSLIHALLLSAAGAAGQSISAPSCPLTLPTSFLQVRGPQGWTGYAPGPLHLFGFGMMDGPPESLTYLVPIESKSTAGKKAISWLVTGNEIWLHCNYGGSDSIQISRVIARGVSRCTVEYRESRSGGRITAMAVNCQAKNTAE